MIPFNKPFLSGSELQYIRQAVESGKISGDGQFTHKCQELLEARYGFHKTLLTSSCTDALEMTALLCNLKKGDEVIAPSFTFVSTVNPFVLAGADIVFCDVKAAYPCIDEDKIEELITSRTRAIIVMHYGGIACNMDKIMELANRYGLMVIEDAAHAIDAYYKDRPLGSFGHLSAFSFHETKNVSAGEGGCIVLNDGSFVRRAEIVREKGTNRSSFFRGEIDKYSWVDVGSSFLPSEVTAAFLYAQLESIDTIQKKRKKLWNIYQEALQPLAARGIVQLPVVPPFAAQNGHLFYITTAANDVRTRLIRCLDESGIMAIFHYQPLHSSPFWANRYRGPRLTETERFSDTLLRLPLYFELTEQEVTYISKTITDFYSNE